MKKHRTQRDFFEKCKEKIDSSLYDWSIAKYVSSKTKVDIVCKRCNNIFQIAPNNFLQGKGCPPCNIKQRAQKQRKTLKEVIDEIKTIHGDKYDYSYIEDYQNNHTKLKLHCKKHGFFFKDLSSLIGKEAGCQKCTIDEQIIKQSKTKEQFLIDCKVIHGEKYDYGKVDYVNCKIKVSIYCKYHKEYFLQMPLDHIGSQRSGCPKCGRIKLSKNQTKPYSQFLQEAINLHGDSFIYDESSYTNCKSKMNIYCKKHNLWDIQTPDSHLVGCSPCNECRIENPSGWNHTSWEKAGERSKRFDGYKVYIIRCWNDQETFYKIGRTFTKVEKRFKSQIPYKYEILNTIEFESARECCEYEQKLKNEHSEHKYLPNLKFGGMYECFSNIKTELITL